MTLTAQEEAEIRNLRGYFPFRRIWIAEGPAGERDIICKTDARMAKGLARKGWKVYEVK